MPSKAKRRTARAPLQLARGAVVGTVSDGDAPTTPVSRCRDEFFHLQRSIDPSFVVLVASVANKSLVLRMEIPRDVVTDDLIVSLDALLTDKGYLPPPSTLNLLSGGLL